MTLYLIPKHNYYNRKIVKYNNVSEYIDAFGLIDLVDGVNFISNDSITTTQVVNYNALELATGLDAPGYVLVTDNGNIVSRWWVTESVLIRNGQARLSLLRDVIADYKETILKAPSFITKGYVRSVHDTAIYNNEDMSFNQIKTRETPIKDFSNTGWYVGYLDKTAGGESVDITGISSYPIIADYASEADYPYNAYRGADNPFIGDYTDLTMRLNMYNINIGLAEGWDENGNPKIPSFYQYSVQDAANGVIISRRLGGFPIYPINGISLQDMYGKISEAAKLATVDWKTGSYGITGAHTGSELNAFLDQENKYIRIAGITYRVIIHRESLHNIADVPNTSIFAQNFRNVAIRANELANANCIAVNDYVENSPWSSVEYKAVGYKIELVAQSTADITYTLPVDRNRCVDASYDLVIVPAGPLYIGNDAVATSPELSRKVIDTLMLAVGSKAYDWQYLPYCPLDDYYMSDLGRISTARLPNSSWYNIIAANSDSDYKTIAIYPRYSNFQKINYTRIDVPTDPVEFKIANECDMYRLCSPNYNGQFEFSATKNNGVSSWNISCSYKPFTPYIRIQPEFKKLYGTNFEDARGLICGGDFSITQKSDAWTEYQINNKNFQAMFDRQIENMEVNNAVQRTLEKVNAITGTFQGAASGGMTGAMTGSAAGIWGTAIGAAGGAIGGGIATGLGGRKDRELNDKLRAEALDYAKDQYGYQLQNIQALPYSLTKVSAMTNDFKIWPFVEYYTCSDYEKEALQSKLTWNGMTIGRIGEIRSFLKPTGEETFVQAKPIRLEDEDLERDSRVLEVISIELQTGVYIQ